MAGLTSFDTCNDWDMFYKELLAEDVNAYEWYFHYKGFDRVFYKAIGVGGGGGGGGGGGEKGSIKMNDTNDISFKKHSLKFIIGGCGNSNLSADLYEDGFINITSFDYSTVCIDAIKIKHSHLPIRYDVEDCTKLTYADNSFDIFVDKGLYDALATRSDSKEALSEMLLEIERVLVKDGLLVIISHSSYESRKEIFRNWRLVYNELLENERLIYVLQSNHKI